MSKADLEKEFRRRIERIVIVLAGVVCALATTGCSESVLRQYTRFKGWIRPGDQTTVLSGSPSQDVSAFDASSRRLSEADWAILERIAPRPLWERIDHLRGQSAKQDPTTRPRRRGAAPASQPQEEQPPDVDVFAADGNSVRIIYRLRHYGGKGVQSVYDGGTDRMKVTLSPPEFAPLLKVVGEALSGKGTVSPLPAQNALAIVCPAAMKDKVLELLACIDRPPGQVEIRARIFEVSQDFDFQFGARTIIEHIASDNTQSVVSTFSTPKFLDSLTNTAAGDYAFQGSVLRLLQVFQDAGISLDATFQALADTGLVNVVSAPRMTVAAGQSAYMLAGQELPIQSAKVSNDRLVTERTSYKPVGVQLHVTPKVVGPNSVELHVITSVTAVAGFTPRQTVSEDVSARPLVNPILDSREAETSVTVQDNSTLVISGLRVVRTITREDKVPGLGDIRGLEWFFKNHRSQKKVTDLYFFITPHLLQ